MSERVRFRCPGCGSELETPEGTVSNLCTYCGLVSLLGRPGRVVRRFYPPACDAQEARVLAEREIKKEGLPLLANGASVELHFVPFYRFRGLSLTCMSCHRPTEPAALESEPDVRAFELRARLVDVTTPGCSSHPFGLSGLGIRPQAVTAWAYRDDEIPGQARVWPVDLGPAEAEQAALRMNEANATLVQGGKAREFAEMVGEHQTVIFFPVFLIAGRLGSGAGDVTLVLDGLARRALSISRERSTLPEAGQPVDKTTPWTPEPHRCPNCGSGLPASERSLFYACSNCSRLWLLTAAGYEPLPAMQVGEGPGDLYPFWRIPITFARQPGFATVGAFSRLLTADLPLLDKRKAQLPFFVYVPAFAGADAEWQVHTAVRMTRTQPLVQPTASPVHEAAPASLPAAESCEFARFAWDWLRMGYLNLRSDVFAWKAATSGRCELAWLPVTCERLSRSVRRAGQEVTASTCRLA